MKKGKANLEFDEKDPKPVNSLMFSNQTFRIGTVTKFWSD